ncbi:cell wall-binding repeat-containing protein [Quadrisphaera sp. KR29]|uniref:cell wall-binding repeat-containing protein n=1 Tax=Quadrisphaera sp. KR29 TaxID=3461391 RepID=UPI0040446F82
MAKRTAAGTLALAVCLGGGAIALAGAASADANFKFDTRVAGADRVATAIEASKLAFPDAGKTENVVLVNGFATVDGLTASYLAGVANAPILYIDEKGADKATQDEIKRLGAKHVWLVGGTAKIPTSVEEAIKADGKTVHRVSGKDRYETAAAIAEAGAKLAGKKPAKVLVASGESFADALAVSPVAYGKGYPIILVKKDEAPEASKKELGDLGANTKILVGGKAVVSEGVEKELTITTRVSGADRAVTANLVAEWAKTSEGFKKDHAILVGGGRDNGADSLVASAFGGKAGFNLHFAGWDATETYLRNHSSELTGRGFVFGGKAAVPDAQVEAAQKAAQTVVSNQSIKVAPEGGETKDVSTSAAGETNKGSRTFTVTGLSADTKYTIALLPADNVTIGKDGVAVFKDANKDNRADDLGTGNAIIEVVNGATTGNVQLVEDVEAQGGTIKFSLDSTAFDDVVPVVFVDSTDNNALDLVKPAKANNNDKRAAEAHGVGGPTRWIPTEAVDGSFDVTVLYVDKEKNYFVGVDASGTTDNDGTTKRYDYADGDTFTYVDGASKPLSGAQFEAALSKGDVIEGTDYSRDYKSDFEVTSDELEAPSAPSAKVGNYDASTSTSEADDAKLSWTAPNPADGLIGDYEVSIFEADEDDTETTPANTAVTGFSAVSAGATDTEYVAENLDNGDYVYYVRAVSRTGAESEWSKLGAFTVQVGDKDTTAPTITDATFKNVNDADEDGTTEPLDGATTLDFGDEIRLEFSEDMKDALATDGRLRVVDADGQTFEIQIGVNATAVLDDEEDTSVSPAIDKNETVDDVLVITLTDAPKQVAGTTSTTTATAGAQLTAKITVLSDGFADQAGNKVDLAKSLDVDIDSEF